MRKSNVFILLFMLLSSSCTGKEKAEVQEPKDFSYLKIQTVLPPEDQAYYERVHNEINEIGKHFAYREENAMEKYCPVLRTMFNEISVRSISKERERERDREIYLLSDFCNQDGVFSKTYKPMTYEEYKYISKKINNSASVYSALASYEGNLMYKSNSSIKEIRKKSFENYWKQSFTVDSLDLLPYRYQDSTKAEYCKKAVELKQWDHIYYLTQVNSTMHIISCLDPSPKYASFSSYCCREAMKLAVKGWSKKDLYDVVNIDVSADGISEKDYKETKKDLRNAILKATGRDLDKEP